MAKLNIPQSGENILSWAKKATREINSLQPTEGQGQKITKTANGTTYSVDKSTIPFPDSQPKIVNDSNISSDSVSLSVAFGTTYSIEKNEQNAFSMFGFSNLSSAISDYPLSDELSGVDVIVRDRGTDNAILSAPTARYIPISCLIGVTLGKLPWITDIVWDKNSHSLVKKYYDCTLKNGLVANLHGLSSGTSAECDLSSLILSGILPTSQNRYQISSILEPLSAKILEAVPEQI